MLAIKREAVGLVSSTSYLRVLIVVILPPYSRTLVSTSSSSGANQQESYKVVEHKTLLVPCNYTKHDDIQIYWTKNETGSKFYQAGSNLMFTDIVRDDSGDYICHAFNTSLPGNSDNYNITVEVINVDVLYPAKITKFHLYPNVINENETFNVNVSIEGNPPPNWRIRNDDTGTIITSAFHFTTTGVAFEDIRVTCGDTGFVECTGRNKLNQENTTRGANLTVLCPPRLPEGSSYQKMIKSEVGKSEFLQINVVGYPSPSYRWSRVDGKPMPDWIQNDYPRFTTLNMTDIQPKDFTAYILEITNDYGRLLAPFELKAYGHPQRPYNLIYSDLTYNSVKLSWTSGFDMGSKQHFLIMELIGNQFIQISDQIYEDYFDHGIGQRFSYTQNYLNSDTEYNLTVMAGNEDGFLSTLADDPVHFRTKVNPNPDPEPRYGVAERNIKILIGSICGFLSLVGFCAFVVYMVKYRRMRTSYETMKGSTKS